MIMDRSLNLIYTVYTWSSFIGDLRVSIYKALGILAIVVFYHWCWVSCPPCIWSVFLHHSDQLSLLQAALASYVGLFGTHFFSLSYKKWPDSQNSVVWTLMLDFPLFGGKMHCSFPLRIIPGQFLMMSEISWLTNNNDIKKDKLKVAYNLNDSYQTKQILTIKW